MKAVVGWTLHRAVQIVGGLVVALLILIPTLTYWNTHQLNENARWVARTQEVLGLTADVLLALVDAETGERGFIITGNDAFLQPYHAALASLDDRLENLKNRTKDNLRQQNRIRKLEELVALRLALLKQAIDLRRKGEREVRTFVAARKGKEHMDAIRELLGDVKREETDRLHEQERASSSAYRTAVATGLLTALLGLGMVGAFGWLLQRSLLGRQQAAEVLHEQREWFRTTLASIGDAVIVTDVDGKVKFLNPVARTMTGWPGDEALGQYLENVFQIINEETRKSVENPAHRALKESRVVGLANSTILIARDGTERPIDDSAAPIKNAAGSNAGVVLIFRDVTEKRRAEAALRQSEERFRFAVEAVPNGMVMIDVEGRIVLANAQLLKMFGYEEQELLDQPLELLVPDHLRVNHADLRTRYIQNSLARPMDAGRELLGVRKDGREFPVETGLNPIRTSQGLLVLASVIDVTERRNKEAHLRESEARFRLLADSIPQLVWMARADGYVHWYNRQWYEYTGTTPERMEGWGWQSVLDPAELPRVLERWRVSLTSGDPLESVFPLRSADGQFGSFLTRILPVRGSEGQILHWVGTYTDITERVQMEASLRRSQEEALKNQEILRLVHQIGRIGHWEWNAQTDENKWSPEIEALYGLPPGGFEGGYEGWARLVHPDDLARAEEDVRRALETGEYFTEFRVIWPDGSIHCLETRANVFMDAEGKAARIVGVNMDITARKQVEQALQQAHDELEQRVRDRTAELTEVNRRLCREIEERRTTEARLREHAEEIETLMDVLPVPVWITHDPECRQMTGNKATYELTRLPQGANVSKSAPLPERPTFRTYQDNREAAPEDLPMQRAMSTGSEVRNAELDLVFEDGSIRSIFGFAAPLFGPDRRVRGCIGAFIDITERQRLEKRLRESEERYRAVVEDQTEVVSRLQADGTFLFVNDVYCRTFGKSHDELIGQQWVPVAHPEDLPSIEAKLATLAPENPIIRIENRVFDAAGQVRWMEFVNRAFFDPAGELTEIQAVGRDVTERKQIEERLRTSLRDKDALLKEVHHRVKNNLAITVSLLNFQIRKASDLAVVETLRQAQNRVRSMAMVHELLYHSESLAGIDLLAYVKQLTRQLLISYDASNRIVLEVHVQPLELSLDLAIPFGLILNELVSNACKHAYPINQQGKLLVSVKQDQAGFVRLTVADEGVGVPDGLDPISSRSLGLRLVRDLTQQLNGTLEVIHAPGTAFHVRFPNNPGAKG